MEPAVQSPAMPCSAKCSRSCIVVLPHVDPGLHACTCNAMHLRCQPCMHLHCHAVMAAWARCSARNGCASDGLLHPACMCAADACSVLQSVCTASAGACAPGRGTAKQKVGTYVEHACSREITRLGISA